MHHRFLLATAAALLVAGCGGSAGSSGTPPTSSGPPPSDSVVFDASNTIRFTGLDVQPLPASDPRPGFLLEGIATNHAPESVVALGVTVEISGGASVLDRIDLDVDFTYAPGHSGSVAAYAPGDRGFLEVSATQRDAFYAADVRQLGATISVRSIEFADGSASVTAPAGTAVAIVPPIATDRVCVTAIDDAVEQAAAIVGVADPNGERRAEIFDRVDVCRPVFDWIERYTAYAGDAFTDQHLVPLLDCASQASLGGAGECAVFLDRISQQSFSGFIDDIMARGASAIPLPLKGSTAPTITTTTTLPPATTTTLPPATTTTTTTTTTTSTTTTTTTTLPTPPPPTPAPTQPPPPAPPPTLSPCPNGYIVNESPPFRLCQRGETIRSIQQALRSLGYAVTVDGEFGPGTEAAVIRLERDNGWPVTGQVPWETMTALFPDF
jgi:hypothetical protein